MKCPHCNKELEFETYVVYNVEVYGKPLIGRAKCCGKGLRVSRKMSFSVSILGEFEQPEVDDWGVALNK